MKISHNFPCSAKILTAIAAFLILAAPAARPFAAASSAAENARPEQAGVSINLSNADHLNILTNQYVVDYARAVSLRAKARKAGPDAQEAVKKYEEANDKQKKSCDMILTKVDDLLKSGNLSDVSTYAGALCDNYPNRHSYFRPIFDRLRENIKFRMANTPDKASAGELSNVLKAVDEGEAKFSNKKPAASAQASPAQQPGDGTSGTTNSSTATDFSDGAASSAQPAAAESAAGAADEAAKAGEKEKEWTFLVYMNADNDLESAGIKDINEMETVGSDARINIVVQCDRSPEYDESNGNWVGSRRFFVTRDQDTSTVNSKMVKNLGESVDMGDPAVLSDFLKWGIKSYPAKKYAVVIWNHGSGWKFQNARFSPVKGISYDESSGNHLDNFKLTAALAEGVKANGGKKLDVLIMDACLMAMIEVAYQVRDAAEIYVASEEVAPGDGMPYEMILAKLAAKPEIDGRELGQIMVENYIRSYKGGSQGWANCTCSAVDLSAIDNLAQKVDALSKALIRNFDKYSYPILLSRLKVLKYSDADYADLYNFCQLIQGYSKDPEIGRLCDDVMDAIGRPDMKGDYYESFNAPIVVTSEKDGVMKWNINDKALPPADYMPAGSKVSSDKTFVETPLAKDEQGSFRAVIGPFNGTTQVNSVQYTIFYKDGGAGSEKIISSSNFFFSKPAGTGGAPAAVIAEGHSQSLSASRGVSIYLTPFEDFLLGYKNLDFSRKFAWADFISFKPPFKTAARVLVVPDTGYVSSDIVYSKFYHLALNQAKINYDLYLPAIYGEIEEETLNRYKDGVVVWYTSKNANCVSKAEEMCLARYIENGGRLFINGQNIEQLHGLSKFFTDTLGAMYVEDAKSKTVVSAWNKLAGQKFELGGDGGANNVSEPSAFNLASDRAQKIFTYGDGGQIAGIKNGKVVFLGFSFESIASGDARAALMKAVIDELMPAGEGVNLIDKY